MMPRPIRLLLHAALVAAPAAVAAQMPPGDDARCWIAIRITGPEAMRVTEREAEERLRLRCRAGDALVLLTDLGRPVGGLAARYCDMARPILVESADAVRAHHSEDSKPAEVVLAVCTYRGAPRADR